MIREGIGENLTVGKKVLCVRRGEWWGSPPTIQWCVIERKLGEGPTDEGVGVRFRQKTERVRHGFTNVSPVDVHYTTLREELERPSLRVLTEYGKHGQPQPISIMEEFIELQGKRPPTLPFSPPSSRT